MLRDLIYKVTSIISEINWISGWLLSRNEMGVVINFIFLFVINGFSKRTYKIKQKQPFNQNTAL